MHAELLIAPDLQGGLKHVGRAGKAERHALVLVRNEAPRYTCWGFETVSDMIVPRTFRAGSLMKRQSAIQNRNKII